MLPSFKFTLNCDGRLYLSWFDIQCLLFFPLFFRSDFQSNRLIIKFYFFFLKKELAILNIKFPKHRAKKKKRTTQPKAKFWTKMRTFSLKKSNEKCQRLKVCCKTVFFVLFFVFHSILFEMQSFVFFHYIGQPERRMCTCEGALLLTCRYRMIIN